MKTLNLEYQVEKKQEKGYYFLPFEVPENVERMDISYSYEGDKANGRITHKEKNVIDFGLLDQNGDDMGSRGSEVRSITISPSYSTNGYKKKDIEKGIWNIIIGAYQIKKEGVTVNYKIEFHEKRYRWLKGDSHVHTDYSDGKYSREKICEKAKKKGLDFLFITDHNNNLEGVSIPEKKGLSVIKGVELTNYKGHINIFGLEKPYDGSFAINSREEFIRRNKQAKQRGALQSINHPLCSLCPWLLGFEDIEYDAIEVWNGPMRKDNLRAVEWWHKQLVKGRKIPIIGGSDYHRDFFVTDLLAHPALRVYADCNSPKSIMEGIKKGRCVITHSPKSTIIEMKYNGKGIGETAEFIEDSKLKITVYAMKRKHKLKVFDKDGCYFEKTAKRNDDFSFDVPVRGKGFVRCEIEYNKSFFAKVMHKIALYFMLRKEAYEKVPPFIYAITNPIYLN